MAVVLSAQWFAAGAMATGFTYKDRDLCLGLRQAGSAFEMTIDLGPAATYYNANPGTVISLGQFSSNQLANAFSAFDDLTWSVSGAVYVANDGSDPTIPASTLWVTRARTSPTAESNPWQCYNASSQGDTAARIASIGQNAMSFSNNRAPDPISNTTNAVIIPAGDRADYSQWVGASGNFQGTFQGRVEATTPSDFSSGQNASRADLYELRPTDGAQAGKYLGYFELKADGTMSFTAGVGSQVTPQPTFVGPQITNGVFSVSFATMPSVTYTLHVTNSAGLSTPVTSWPIQGSPIVGDGTTKQLQDSSSDANRFYGLEARP